MSRLSSSSSVFLTRRQLFEISITVSHLLRFKSVWTFFNSWMKSRLSWVVSLLFPSVCSPWSLSGSEENYFYINAGKTKGWNRQDCEVGGNTQSRPPTPGAALTLWESVMWIWYSEYGRPVALIWVYHYITTWICLTWARKLKRFLYIYHQLENVCVYSKYELIYNIYSICICVYILYIHNSRVEIFRCTVMWVRPQ